MSGESISYNFSSFIVSYVSLSVIAGLFTYRVLNSFLDNIILPLLDISILPDTKFHRLTKVYNHKKTEIKEIIKKQDIQYVISPGIFLKELIIWCFMMMLLYIIYKLTKKN
jgi:large-conductance mechanosensitive channel